MTTWQRDGIRLALCKGRIEFSGAKEAVSANMVRRIRANKPGLIALLTDELLERAARPVPGITADDLRANLDELDWQDADLIAHEPLRALAHCIRNSRDIQAGKTPAGWTATTWCQNCSKKAPTFPGGKDTVLACVWCLNGQSVPTLPQDMLNGPSNVRAK